MDSGDEYEGGDYEIVQAKCTEIEVMEWRAKWNIKRKNNVLYKSLCSYGD